MDRDLLDIWQTINKDCFGGRLRVVTDIDWHQLSGEDNLDAFGIYIPQVGSIAIDERFKFDKARCAARDEVELAKVEVAYRIVMHEMIHQALHQKEVDGFGGHGTEFVDEAAPIAAKLGGRSANGRRRASLA